MGERDFLEKPDSFFEKIRSTQSFTPLDLNLNITFAENSAPA